MLGWYLKDIWTFFHLIIACLFSNWAIHMEQHFDWQHTRSDFFLRSCYSQMVVEAAKHPIIISFNIKESQCYCEMNAFFFYFNNDLVEKNNRQWGMIFNYFMLCIKIKRKDRIDMPYFARSLNFSISFQFPAYKITKMNRHQYESWVFTFM